MLVLAPTARDGELSEAILAEAGIACTAVFTVADLIREIEAGAGAVLLTEESLGEVELAPLLPVMERQPSWSELPFIVLVSGGTGAPGVAASAERLGNALVLERPVPVATLVGALRLALSARRRQYEVRDHLLERQRVEEALRATGVSWHVPIRTSSSLPTSSRTTCRDRCA